MGSAARTNLAKPSGVIVAACLVALGCGDSTKPETGSNVVSSAGAGGGSSVSGGSAGAAGTGTNPASAGTLNLGTEPVTPDPPTLTVAGCTDCALPTCPSGATTSLSGIVRTPAKVHADPLYNAVVYIPGAELESFAPGVTCDRCGNVSGKPVAATLSGTDGKFTLKDIPAGHNVPVVLQMGRWRRRVVVPEVVACKDNPLDAELTRFPRNRTEGDIPQVALVTSQYDPEECILRKIGIDDAEFTNPTQPGRVHVYAGGGALLDPRTPSGDTLWGDAAALARYDMVLLPCDSIPNTGPFIDPIFGDPATAAPGDPTTTLAHYADIGGRVFATDLSMYWLDDSTPFAGAAVWSRDPLASSNTEAQVDTSFPKGQALSDWLANIGVTPNPGQINLVDAYLRASSVVSPTQRWLYSTEREWVHSFTFNTPIKAPEAQQCGRFAYSSFHIAKDVHSSGAIFPQDCDELELTPQERVLEFMLFDLASCVQIDQTAPKPPVIK